MTLTIDELEQSTPDMITDVDIRKVEDKLKQQGIEISYITTVENSDGGNTWSITKKPDDMDDVDVWHLIYSAMGYYYPGPWTFTVRVTP